MGDSLLLIITDSRLNTEDQAAISRCHRITADMEMLCHLHHITADLVETFRIHLFILGMAENSRRHLLHLDTRRFEGLLAKILDITVDHTIFLMTLAATTAESVALATMPGSTDTINISLLRHLTCGFIDTRVIVIPATTAGNAAFPLADHRDMAVIDAAEGDTTVFSLLLITALQVMRMKASTVTTAFLVVDTTGTDVAVKTMVVVLTVAEATEVALASLKRKK